MRIWRGVVAVIVVVVSVVYAFSVYWAKAHANYSSTPETHRYRLLMQLHAAIESCRTSTGHWPEDHDVLRDLAPSLREEDLTGANRIVYRKPKSHEVVLVSFGHLEAVPGWDLIRDEVVWLVPADGMFTEAPRKTFERLGIGAGGSDSTK